MRICGINWNPVWIRLAKAKKPVACQSLYEDQLRTWLQFPMERPWMLLQMVRGELAHRLQEFTPLMWGDGRHAFVSLSVVVQGYNTATTRLVNRQPVNVHICLQDSLSVWGPQLNVVPETHKAATRSHQIRRRGFVCLFVFYFNVEFNLLISFKTLYFVWKKKENNFYWTKTNRYHYSFSIKTPRWRHV